ncbi:Component of oligomeric golgi complex 8 [Carabus blaptoides fortunei]
MDIETDRLVKLIFQNNIPDDWLRSPDFHKYLLKLGTYSVEDLIKEPGRLSEEKNSILEQTQELACKNYKTFVQTAECSRDIFKQFSTTESRLDSLLEKIPVLEKQCESFAKTTRDINVNRRLNSLTLTRNAQLLEILELPQLMNSFIQEEQYENALELTNYVRRLGVKHPEIPIFKSIVLDVEKSWRTMLHQLIAQLRQDLQLPRCLQIVGYLRRMEVFSEAELRLKFLQARDAWLQTSLSALPSNDANHHLNKTIEVTRINLFNIVTQYRAIFNDDEHSPLNASRDKDLNENLIFYCWLQEKISAFLKTLRADLKRGVLSIDSILSQCMYFGLSFSRVGCDFRGLMVPIFTETIYANFEKSVVRTTRDFEKNMERFTLINKNCPSAPWKSTSSSADSQQPPETLLEFYPLAEYCNQILTAFNELRLCAPFAILHDVTVSLSASLCTVARTILLFYGQEQQAFTQTAREAFTRLCTCFTDDLIPYLQRCLHVLYPPIRTAQMLGISVVQLLQTEQLASLDRASIVRPIVHLLPVKIEPELKVDESGSVNAEAKLEENGSLEVDEQTPNTT